MIYRIDRQKFLLYAIDYFTRKELTNMNYAIISAAIRSGGCDTHVSKINELYPTPEIIMAWDEYKDKSILEKMYLDLLDPPKDSGEYPPTNTIYSTFINPLLNHYDVTIVCDESENVFIDILVKYLKDKFGIDVINLNELFTKGHVGKIYIDRKKIWNKAVDIRREAGREQVRALETTSEGRSKLMGMMTKKMKIKKLKELGVEVTDADMGRLDELLICEWVNDD